MVLVVDVNDNSVRHDVMYSIMDGKCAEIKTMRPTD